MWICQHGGPTADFRGSADPGTVAASSGKSILITASCIDRCYLDVTARRSAQVKCVALEEARLMCKSQIYRYRTRTGMFAEKDNRSSWDVVLEKYRQASEPPSLLVIDRAVF